MSSSLYTKDNKIKDIDLIDLFPPNAGQISQIYGRIGSGKTYIGTAMVLDLLRQGQVVYANWRIKWEGYDQRKSKAYILRSILFPWLKRFYYFPKDNLHYLPIDENFHSVFEKLTDCHVFLDEGHVVFDSYEMARMDMKRRMSILHTRHFDRSIHIISQRPTAIHVAMRANVNVFYKCQKIWEWNNFVRFKRTEYQDMIGETVNEDEELAIDTTYYWGKKKVFEAYNTKYLRGDIAPSQKIMFEAYDIPLFRRISLFFDSFKRAKIRSINSPRKLDILHLSLEERRPIINRS